jgi:hypothetical protein
MPLRQTMQGLASEELLGDLALERDAVGSMLPCNGSSSENPAPRSIPSSLPVRRQGRTPIGGQGCKPFDKMLGWLVHERGIEPHVPVFDKSKRTDGTFSREDFTYDHQGDVYICPGGKILTCKGTVVNDNQLLYRASKYDCDICRLKPRCCPKEPARKVPRSIHEGARDLARDIALTEAYRASRRQRKKVEMLFAHLKRILRLDRLRLRGPCGARDEFLLAATAQNLRKLAKLITPPTPMPAT